MSFKFKNNQVDKERNNVLTKSEFVKFLGTYLNKGTDEEVRQEKILFYKFAAILDFLIFEKSMKIYSTILM